MTKRICHVSKSGLFAPAFAFVVLAFVPSVAEGASITLTWNDNSSNETGFKIERSTDNIDFEQIAVVGENVTKFTDSSALEFGQFYAYRVRAFNEHGHSGYANTATTRFYPEPEYYFGEFESGSGSFGIIVRGDGSAFFLGAIEGVAGGGIAREFQMASDGGFTFHVSGVGWFSGFISEGSVSAVFELEATEGQGLSIASGNDFLEGTRESADGSTKENAGFYESDTVLGKRVLILVGPDGKGLVVASSESEISASEIAIAEDGVSNAELSDGTRISFGIGGGSGVSGSISNGSEVVDFLGVKTRDPNKSVIANASFRTPIGARSTVSAGFVVKGLEEKRLLIRAVGPTLSSLGVPRPVKDPRMILYRQGAPTSIASNDQWESKDKELIDEIGEESGAFPLAEGSADSAMLVTLSEGLYWVHVVNPGAEPGTALVELYDVDALANVSTKSSIVNFSMRGTMNSNADPIIAGFVVTGKRSKGLLVRAMGNELRRFGVSNIMSDPIVEIFRFGDSGSALAFNDDWREDGDLLVDIARDVGAFDFEEASRSAAKAMWLDPNLYTVVVKNGVGSQGEVLLEVYEIQ